MPFGKFSELIVTPGPRRFPKKIGVVVAEESHTWEIFLPSLGYQMLQIYSPAGFWKFLQGGTLSEAELLPPNQQSRLSNLQDSCSFVSGVTRGVHKGNTKLSLVEL